MKTITTTIYKVSVSYGLYFDFEKKFNTLKDAYNYYNSIISNPFPMFESARVSKYTKTTTRTLFKELTEFGDMVYITEHNAME